MAAVLLGFILAIVGAAIGLAAYLVREYWQQGKRDGLTGD